MEWNNPQLSDILRYTSFNRYSALFLDNPIVLRNAINIPFPDDSTDIIILTFLNNYNRWNEKFRLLVDVIAK